MTAAEQCLLPQCLFEKAGCAATSSERAGLARLRPAGDALHEGVSGHQRERGGAQQLAVRVELQQDGQPG